ncbi:MAG TPA: hypothetical protein VJ521_06400, partial [Acidobacteriota bacterium]|nr:hypothetical protein [Acidobacteriota bacterium]
TVVGWRKEAAKCLRAVPVNAENIIMMDAAGLTSKVLDWLEQNKRYFRAANAAVVMGNYTRAAENFRKDGSENEGARILERNKQFDLAIQLYKEAGNLQKAATILERLKQYEQAAQLWQRLGNPQRQQACLKKIKHKQLPL